jgi:hypothetical protein
MGKIFIGTLLKENPQQNNIYGGLKAKHLLAKNFKPNQVSLTGNITERHFQILNIPKNFSVCLCTSI